MNSYKIVVIEDDATLAKMLVKGLQDEGFDVLHSDRGESGLRLALKERPDLILADVLLPDLDGIAMVRRLREDEWGKNAAVIFLTSLDDSNKVAEAMEVGTYEYLVKADWPLHELIKKVKEKLG